MGILIVESLIPCACGEPVVSVELTSVVISLRVVLSSIIVCITALTAKYELLASPSFCYKDGSSPSSSINSSKLCINFANLRSNSVS